MNAKEFLEQFYLAPFNSKTNEIEISLTGNEVVKLMDNYGKHKQRELKDKLLSNIVPYAINFIKEYSK